jgi:hypothetical protein
MQNYRIYGVNRLNRAFIVLIPLEVSLFKLDEFTHRLFK